MGRRNSNLCPNVACQWRGVACGPMNATHCKNCKTLLQKDEKPWNIERKRKAVTDMPEAALPVLQQAFDDVDGDADALRPRLAELAKQADCDEAVVTQFFADRRSIKERKDKTSWHSVQRIKRVTEKTAEATAVYKNLVQAC